MNLEMTNVMNEVHSTVDVEQPKELPASMTDTSSYQLKLREDPQVRALTDRIDINDSNSIVLFGAEPSTELSKISDQLLNSLKVARSDEASEMLNALTKIMDKFDIKEIENPEEYAKKSGLAKLFGKAKDSLQKLFEKYDSMGKEVEEIYVILNKYAAEIRKSNEILGQLYRSNTQYYEDLEKYIVAGEMGIEEIDTYEAQMNQRTDISPEEIANNVQKLEIMKNMLSQRVYDLRVSENVALQTAPMIRSMEVNNFNLMLSIQSAFITTLPIFKNCLISAIQLKQQAIQAKSISQLNEKTNELLLRNAQNNATQSVAIAKQANSSAITIETLQKSYDTIKKGIEDTRAITVQMADERSRNTQTLETMKVEMKSNGWA
jgi:uncharacterized protein YaaN involved in tellurite resistance